MQPIWKPQLAATAVQLQWRMLGCLRIAMVLVLVEQLWHLDVAGSQLAGWGLRLYIAPIWIELRLSGWFGLDAHTPEIGGGWKPLAVNLRPQPRRFGSAPTA